jgi:glutamate---cysteine ligase / carboxylate-amine ligase
VIEAKTASPVAEIFPMAAAFQEQVQSVNRWLARENCRLLPGGMHPWMDPASQTRLWPHGDREIYDAFDGVFGCQGHGWSNLQSSHLNLPFHDEASFVRLHHGIRLLLPILPAIAASSPIVDGRPAPALDHRLTVYRNNCLKIPQVTGEVVPEPVRSREEYRDHILAPMYREMARHDPEEILCEEWLNARGAIARFERNTIEIRVLDAQECPRADLAIHAVVEQLVKHLEDAPDRAQAELVDLYEAAVRIGLDAEASPGYVELFGVSSPSPLRLRELWRQLLSSPILSGLDASVRQILNDIITHGSLAERLLRSIKNSPDGDLRVTYPKLAACLDQGTLFLP